MATAGSIVVDLLMKTGSFETDSKRAEKQLRELQKTAVSAGKAIGAGLVAAGAGIAVMAKQAINAADEMDELSEKLGVNITALTQLDFAAKISGVDIDTLSGGITRLTKFMVDAADAGSEQAKIFDALGIQATDAAGGLRDADDVFRDLAGVFAGLPDGAEKTALAIKVLGKSGAELIPLLNQGADGLDKFAAKSDAVGYTLNTVTGKAAGSFNEKLDELTLSIDGLWRESLPGLLPKLDDFADLLNSDEFRSGFETLIGGAATAVGWLAKLATTTASVTSFLGEEFAARIEGPSVEDLVRTQDKLGRLRSTDAQLAKIQRQGGIPDYTAISELVPGDLLRPLDEVRGRLQGEIATYEKQLKVGQKMAEESAARAAEIAKLAGEAPNTKAPTLAGLGLLDSDPDRKAKATKATKELTAAEKAWQEQEADYAAIAEITEEYRRQKIADNFAMEEARDREIAQVEELIGWMKDDLRILGLSNRERAIEVALRHAGAEATDEQRQRIAELAGALHDENEALDYQVGALDAARDAGRGFFDDLRDGVGPIDALSNAFDRLLDKLYELSTDWVIDQLLGSMGDTGTGAAGRWLGTIAGFFGGAKAGGGDVLSDRAYLVGEQGPELFVPRTAGLILPADETASMSRDGGRAMSVTQNFYNPQLNDPRSETQRQLESANRLRLATARI